MRRDQRMDALIECKDLQIILGHLAYYRHFIRDYKGLVMPLLQALNTPDESNLKTKGEILIYLVREILRRRCISRLETLQVYE